MHGGPGPNSSVPMTFLALRRSETTHKRTCTPPPQKKTHKWSTYRTERLSYHYMALGPHRWSSPKAGKRWGGRVTVLYCVVWQWGCLLCVKSIVQTSYCMPFVNWDPACTGCSASLQKKICGYWCKQLENIKFWKLFQIWGLWCKQLENIKFWKIVSDLWVMVQAIGKY